MAAAGDLQVDFDGIHLFADGLDRLSGQWDGSAVRLDPYSGLGGDAGLIGVADDFTNAWTQAATSIDSFISTLASMCRDAVVRLRQVDSDLANATPTEAHHRNFMD
jgi:hypothetical protein